MPDNLKLSQILSARIFHDLAGPISAVSSGVDYLNSENLEMRNMACNMIESSALKAVYLLQFYRYIYGVLNLCGEANLEEIKNISGNFLDSKIRLNFDERMSHVPKVFISLAKSRIAMCLFISAKGNLLYGGAINVSVHSTSNKHFMKIIAVGEKIKIDINKFNIIQNKVDIEQEVTPHNVHEYYIQELLKQADISISVMASEKSIEYKFEL